MRELSEMECRQLSGATLTNRDFVYQAVYGTINSTVIAGLSKAPGITGVIAAGLLGGLTSILSHVAADACADLVDLNQY